MDFLTDKGVPLGAELDERTLSAGALSIADLATPFATISRPAVEANVAAMRDYCGRHGVLLAPHAKTTLAADLLELQIRNGAWALTAALPRQVALLWQLGFPRVLLANEVADVRAIEWLAGRLSEDERLTLWMYVDSARGLDILTDGVKRAGAPTRPVGVLVELGYPGGRTGCRRVPEALELAQRVAATPGLRLAGVAGYEGTIGVTRDARTVGAVDAYLEKLREAAAVLLERQLVERPIVTVGGSIYFDRVVAKLGTWAAQAGADVVLRSGCYLIHDHGMYATGTPAASGIEDAPSLTAALSVWARVISQPEPGLALLDAGRRDLSHDAGLPVPLQRVRAGAATDLGAESTVIALSDQHAFVRYPLRLDVQVGDLVRLGISHPCTTLDRHRGIFLVDSADRIVGAIRPNF
jgi:D-serine deaminase-like pyridoxal phosphate-dependent protein